MDGKKDVLEKIKEQIESYEFLRNHEKIKILKKLDDEYSNIFKDEKRYTFIIKTSKIFTAERPRIGKFGRSLYAPDADNKKVITAIVKEILREKYPNFNCDYNEINVNIKACFAKPNKMTKFERVCYMLGKMFMCKKPDVDNIAKIYLDACNGLLWKDDADITKLCVEKFYGEENVLTMEVIYK